MKIFLIHNRYLQRGGEDSVVDNEILLLSQKHTVKFYETSSRSMKNNPFRDGLITIWNEEEKKEIQKQIDLFNPDIIHIHNTFPYLSQSILWIESASPIIMTLHNYRSLCLNGLLFRDGAPCEDCVGRGLISGIINKCYRDSFLASSALAASTMLHRIIQTSGRVSRYIALTDFSRRKFIKGGLPADRILVKPNFSEDEGIGEGDGDYALYVGRLSEEKGILTLLNAWEKNLVDLRLVVAGDGDLRSRAQEFESPKITLLGQQSKSEIANLMKRARYVVVPSECYEGLPMAVIESLSFGTPVLCSRIGALGEIIRDGYNGLTFTSGDPDDLIKKAIDLSSMLDSNFLMRENSRKEYEDKYSKEKNMIYLEKIYLQSITEKLNLSSPMSKH